jgi:1-aminocyclopropane-1-carboxylate deaminase/D-cysteine desulfhydrase-like pyridoxal-dependent ACC family enzyme
MHGLMTELKAGRWADVRDVVFILTGGMFGLMAQRAAVLG